MNLMILTILVNLVVLVNVVILVTLVNAVILVLMVILVIQVNIVILQLLRTCRITFGAKCRMIGRIVYPAYPRSHLYVLL